MANVDTKRKLEPVVKWAGGKRQLLDELTSRMPDKYGIYYEPFFGGGALFFAVQPEKAVINDFNSQLVNVYKQLQSNPDEVIKKLSKLQDKYNSYDNESDREKLYYDSRTRFNELISKNILNEESAALVIFLNKCGYNGLYRVNSKGGYNVPWSKRKTLNVFNEDNILGVSKQLKNTKILNGDFEVACKSAKRGDFVFFDSPYYDTFDTYQAGGFNEDSHRRLADLFKRLTDKGVYCMLTNSNTDFIKELYKDYNIEVVDVKRMINCNGKNRIGQEVIITNYDRGTNNG